MRISYNKLWKMLIDKEMNKQDLKEAAGISAASIAKLGKGGNITTDVLLKICETLDCKLEDIIETIKEE
ncbi:MULTISPECIES: helix-turn-helix transcriptional regulator [Caproicibacterium]|uniref:Helix-turn-helix domain-containing protein n=1 Tax=Caproicibacterium lactatifermentans TaxID=2666138 RepID=A0A859DRS2_9FIRM|nr:helix-turn-helix domain-containing protein [Caproicibacterium lactatifermentans]QKN24598.1 helix-turn-helix domain-containing protein [Caproicibacterium lactatifermentans]